MNHLSSGVYSVLGAGQMLVRTIYERWAASVHLADGAVEMFVSVL